MEWRARLDGHFQSPLLVIISSITRVDKVRTWGQRKRVSMKGEDPRSQGHTH